MSLETRPITDTEIQMLKPYTRRQKVYHWGTPSMIKPVLLRTVWGDGKKLLYFRTVNDRPKTYLVLFDSAYDESDSDSLEKLLSDRWTDEIYEVIEEEFGNVKDQENDKDSAQCRRCRTSREEYPCSQCDRYKQCQYTRWPKLDEDCGCEWGLEADLTEH